jgi:hypothetical protein
MRTVINRLYSDYLMPSRLASYDALVGTAKSRGYAQLSVRSFHRLPADGDGQLRTLVHRHDIDSDLRTARKMFDIEQKHGVQASYYFRLSTLDFGFMRAIEAAGSEASYHYEEVADFAKREHLRDAAAVRRRFPEIAALFAANVTRIEQQLGQKLSTVASHGDFANRRLAIINHELLRDPALRLRCGVACETYDRALLDRFDLYISDRPYPQYYHPMSPFAALGRFERICFLTHPVQWETNWTESTRCNLRRLYEEMAW